MAMVTPEQIAQLNSVGVEVESVTEITSGYADILYYDGPILWHGKNASGQRVIGSDLWWNREALTNYYLEAIVSDELFDEYVKMRLSYPNLLRQGELYLIVHTHQGKKFKRIAFDDLPSNMRPDEDAFCPDDFDPNYVNESSGFR